MNTTENAGMIDRRALAEQVIISAGNILAAAGFERTDIADFFTQAADQLRDGPAQKRVPAGESADRLVRVAGEFSQNTAVHELHSIGMKAQAVMPLGSDAVDLRNAFDMAMQAVPLLAEAQQALRTMANEAMLPVVAHRAQRDQSGIDMGDPTQIVCLEDFEALYEGAFDIIGAVADALVKRQDGDAFTFLLGHLADNGVVLNPSLQATIAKATYSLQGEPGTQSAHP